MRKHIALFLSLLVGLTAFAQKNRTVSGIVAEDTGLPVIGATVMVEGTQNGVVTDENGKYTIKCKEGDVLVFSCLGYEDYKADVGASAQINAVMRNSNKMLDELVVIAYGTQAKSDLTGSVGIVNVDELSKTPVTSADQALQGRVAGLEVINGNGDPSAAATMRIRGTRSINANNDPLLVVDGVIDAVESFADINPADIKSISVLKDASSTAMYGSRGANGVILVTTRSGGNTEKLYLRFNADVGVATLPRELDVMNAAEFASYRNDVTYTSYYDSKNLPKYKPAFENPSALGEGTNWQRLLTRPAVKQSYFLALTNGGNNRKVFASIGYNNTQGIIIGTGSQRVTGRFNFEWQLFKNFKAYLNASYIYTANQVNNITMNGYNTNAVACLSPLLTQEDIWNKYGDTETAGGVLFDNPYMKATREQNGNKKHFLVLSPRLEYNFYKGFSLKTAFTYTLSLQDTFYYSPSTMPVASVRHLGGTARRGTNDKNAFLSETTLSWKRTVHKKHKFDILAGFTAEKTRIDRNSLSGSGYMDDNVTFKNMGTLMDVRTLTPSSSISETTRLSVLGRINYSYAKRYYATLTARADGSSIFAKGHKWGWFPAAALKWNLSEERFLSKARRTWLDELSIRVSAGMSGNDGLSSYVSQATLSNTGAGWLFNNGRNVSFYPTRLENDNLTWEKTVSYNIGIDMEILKGRVKFTLEGYQSYTHDMLLAVQNAAATGFTSRYQNCGSTRNSGLELTITSNNISTKNFNWSTTFTIGHNVQVVTDTGAGNEYISTYSPTGIQMFYGYVKGYPVHSLWGYQYAGVWHNDAERARNVNTRTYVSYQDKNGYAKYVDVNHDGVLDKNDWIYLGNTDPLISGGLNNEFQFWNRLSLGIYITYSYGARLYNMTEMYLGSGSANSNQYRYMLNCWHPERNPDSDIVGAYRQDRFGSSRFVHDASYIRLKTLSISYRIPFKQKWLRELSLSLSGDNLLLLTPYNGYDPDVTSNSSGNRIDNGSYPYPRTYSFSLVLRY